MFGIKDIPQSLIDAVNDVTINEDKYEDLVRKGLQKYGVDSPDELSEPDKKEFFNWLDANWKADDEVKEDGLLPGSKNVDEEKGDIELAAGINEVSPPDPEIEKWASDPDVKASFKKQYGDRWQEVLYAKAWQKYNSKQESVLPGFEGLKEDDIPGQDDFRFDAQRDEKEKEDIEEVAPSDQEDWSKHNKNESVNEGISVSPDNLASTEPNSALGQRDSEYPKHVDVVKEDDFRPLSASGTKTEGYRLLIQYSTNTRPQFVPELYHSDFWCQIIRFHGP